MEILVFFVVTKQLVFFSQVIVQVAQKNMESA